MGFVTGLLLFRYLSISDSIENAVVTALLIGLCGIFCAYLVYYSTNALNRIISWQKMPGTRLIVGVLSQTVLLLSCILLLTYIFWVFRGTNGRFLTEYFQTVIKVGILIFLSIFLYSIVYFAIYSYYQYSKVQIEQVELARKQIDLQLNALRAQLSPHYLFNNLNTISLLILKDKDQAEEFIRRLAKSFQYTLSTYERRLVSLEEELLFVDDYVYLLETRFGKNLTVKVNISKENFDQKTPPLALQMLVENAVKHNVFNLENPLTIQIGNDDKWLWVSNNKTEQTKGRPSFKIGLNNINSRYKILTNQEIIIKNDDHFTVKLPVIK